MSFEIAVQTIVYSALTNSAGLMAAINGVYDSVPESEKFPYVTIGEDIHSEDDTGTTLGSNVSVTIHCWTRYEEPNGSRGLKQTKEIQGLIYDALHWRAFTLSGYDVNMVKVEGSQTFLDQDGLTRHGVQTVRILIDKV